MGGKHMPFLKAVSGFFCAGLLTQAGGVQAGENPPLPVPRPPPAATQIQSEPRPNAWSSSPNRNDLGPGDLGLGDLSPGDLRQAINPAGPAARKAYQALIKREAEKNGLPTDIADAVAAVESGYDPGAVGSAGEIGLMQVRPETAAMLGFKGSLAELAEPDVNIHYGVTYLSQAWRLANGDLCRALMKYRAGHGEEIMSALSAAYCGRARAYLVAAGSPFAAGAAVPIVFELPFPRASVARRGPRFRTAAVSRRFWAAQEARVKMITQRLKAKWRRMASR
jgi:hypothetical protein